ncbi:regulatory protein [Streptomyces sp. SPB78]|nr:regulatory protein [Streptomyces sp. SPB78]
MPAPSEDPEEEAATCPEDWPARPDPILAMNRMGSFDWDLDSGRMHMDRQALAVFGLRPERFDDMATTASAQMPRAERDRMAALVKDAITAGHETYAGYFRIRRADGSLRWTHTQGYIRRDAGGRARRIFGIVRDATQELSDTTARREQASELRRRTTVVERTTAALAAARTVADVLDVLREQDGLVRLGADSLVVGLLEQGRIRLVPDGPTGGVIDAGRHTRLDDPYPMADVVRTMRPVYLEDAESFAAAYPELWKQIAHLRPGAAAYLPLVAQGSPIGSLGLFYGGTHHFAPEERNVLVALGSSLAQSLQRAMLYEQEKDLAQGLQQAMLPRTIPDVPGAEVAVRYRAASAGRDVGGDWYDLVPLPGGRTGAVIGDVQGHDTHAAASHGPAPHRAARLRGRGPPARDRHGPHLALPRRTRHRPLRDLPLRRGRPFFSASSSSCAPGTSTPSSWPPTAPPVRVPVPGGLPLGFFLAVRRARLPRLHPGTGPRRDAAPVHGRPRRSPRRRPRRRLREARDAAAHRTARPAAPRRPAHDGRRAARRRGRRRGAAPAPPRHRGRPALRRQAPAARRPGRPPRPRRGPPHDPLRRPLLGRGLPLRRHRTRHGRTRRQRAHPHGGPRPRHPARAHRGRAPPARRGRGLVERPAEAARGRRRGAVGARPHARRPARGRVGRGGAGRGQVRVVRVRGAQAGRGGRGAGPGGLIRLRHGTASRRAPRPGGAA